MPDGDHTDLTAGAGITGPGPGPVPGHDQPPHYGSPLGGELRTPRSPAWLVYLPTAIGSATVVGFPAGDDGHLAALELGEHIRGVVVRVPVVADFS